MWSAVPMERNGIIPETKMYLGKETRGSRLTAFPIKRFVSVEIFLYLPLHIARYEKHQVHIHLMRHSQQARFLPVCLHLTHSLSPFLSAFFIGIVFVLVYLIVVSLCCFVIRWRDSIYQRLRSGNVKLIFDAANAVGVF